MFRNLVIGPLIGAAVGELTVRGDLRGAGKAGLFAGTGFVIGMAAKFGLVLAMLAIAAAALFLF